MMSADAMTMEFPKVDISGHMKAMQDAINETIASLAQFGIAVGGTPIEDRCDYSWLFVSQCAHCLGHVPDWEDPPKVKVYD